MPIFGEQLAESLAVFKFKQITTKSDPICGHETISVASRLLHIIHMSLISDVEVCCWLLECCSCQAMPIFGQQLAESLALFKQIRTKTDPICGHETISVPSRPLHIIHMSLISDVEVCCWLLECCSCPGHANLWTAVGWKFGTIQANQDQNWSHLRSRNHISCLQTTFFHMIPNVIFAADTGSCWPIGVRPTHNGRH
jgi:hypothetical protein